MKHCLQSERNQWHLSNCVFRLPPPSPLSNKMALKKNKGTQILYRLAKFLFENITFDQEWTSHKLRLYLFFRAIYLVFLSHEFSHSLPPLPNWIMYIIGGVNRLSTDKSTDSRPIVGQLSIRVDRYSVAILPPICRQSVDGALIGRPTVGRCSINRSSMMEY